MTFDCLSHPAFLLCGLVGEGEDLLQRKSHVAQGQEVLGPCVTLPLISVWCWAGPLMFLGRDSLICEVGVVMS